MAKKPKPESVVEESVVEEEPIAPVAAETFNQAEALTSDDRGDPAGRALAESVVEAPDARWTPGSCINCGQTSTDAISVLADGRYRCTRCRHEWTLADEQAPFRRLAR